ncbi:glycosyltransferase family 2 protein [Roseateles aquatilis]|uniref:glycosyltransferase family 2 protein n=1 Tax=Roseateles aquatilis TaxID=431061 RepID=UPI0013038F74|nr:glycosyltransferase family 2 protein [Roseateles aquatilis]
MTHPATPPVLPPSLPDVACVIVSFNGAPWMADCLRALRASTVPLRVIVVDNASGDDTRDIVGRFPEATLLPQAENLGFGRANNIGIARALADGAQQVFILNQDTVLAPDAIEHLRREAAADASLGILCPLQLDGDGGAMDPTFLRYYAAPHATAYLTDAVMGRPLAGHYRAHSLPAAAWLLTREFLEQVGGFDPLFFLYCEDDDLCARARHHGFGIALVPTATFRHLRGFHVPASSEPTGKRFRKRRSRLRSIVVNEIKKPEGRFGRNVWYALASQTLQGAMQLFVYFNWLEAVAGWAAVLRVLPEVPRIRRHRDACLTRGPHWLDLPATAPLPATASSPATAPRASTDPADPSSASPTRPVQQ